MPKGPNGEWRPVGDNECAALVCRIATGDSPEVYEPPPAEQKRVRADASAAGMARAEKLSPRRRREIAASGATARWGER